MSRLRFTSVHFFCQFNYPSCEIRGSTTNSVFLRFWIIFFSYFDFFWPNHYFWQWNLSHSAPTLSYIGMTLVFQIWAIKTNQAAKISYLHSAINLMGGYWLHCIVGSTFILPKKLYPDSRTAAYQITQFHDPLYGSPYNCKWLKNRPFRPVLGAGSAFISGPNGRFKSQWQTAPITGY